MTKSKTTKTWSYGAQFNLSPILSCVNCAGFVSHAFSNTALWQQDDKCSTFELRYKCCVCSNERRWGIVSKSGVDDLKRQLRTL